MVHTGQAAAAASLTEFPRHLSSLVQQCLRAVSSAPQHGVRLQNLVIDAEHRFVELLPPAKRGVGRACRLRATCSGRGRPWEVMSTAVDINSASTRSQSSKADRTAVPLPSASGTHAVTVSDLMGPHAPISLSSADASPAHIEGRATLKSTLVSPPPRD